MKPYIHAQSSVKKFGGKVEDYLTIHDWFDQTKSHMGDNRHRAILHNSFGIFLAEQVFGHNITNSDDKRVSVRDIGEQHVVEDLGFIPSVADYLSELEHKPWMSKQGGWPESQNKVPHTGDGSQLVDGSRLTPLVFTEEQRSLLENMGPAPTYMDGSSLVDLKERAAYLPFESEADVLAAINAEVFVHPAPFAHRTD